MRSPGRPCRRWLAVAAASIPALTTWGCLGNVGRAPEESVTSEAFGVQATAQRTRVAALNTETTLLGLIELSADRIADQTDDPVVARNALRWKATAIPVLQRAAHHPDPLISYIDEWAFLLQLRDYLSVGEGRELFGDQQAVAVDPLAAAVETMDRRVAEVVDSVDYRIITAFVDNWARENPIDNALLVRPPISMVAAEALGAQQLGGLDAVGRLEALALDAQQMAQSYLAYTPKVTLWQAQLMVQEMLDTATVGPLLGQVDDLALTTAATRLMEELPELLRTERAATTRELSVVAESALVTLVGLAARERQSVLAEVARLVREERAALGDEVEEALVETLREGRQEALVVIDHILWRVALMGAALIVLLALIQYLLLRAFLARRRGAREAPARG